MAVQSFRLGIVFTIGFCLGPVALSTVATNVTDKPIPLSLRLDDPIDVVVAKKQPATFHCITHTNSSTQLHYKWYFNDSLIGSDDARRKQLDNGTLYIPKVTGRRFEGSYRCLASNKFGSLLSNNATLKIAVMEHEFLEQPKDTIVQEHQSILLKCQIHSIPAANVQWERNNLPLPHNTRYLYTSEALIITNTNLSDSGTYRCTASNKITNKTKQSNSAEITVIPNNNTQRFPEILQVQSNTNNVTALVGETVVLYCIANGWPLPTVRWLNSRSVVISNDTALMLEKITADMEGFYNCSAVNPLGHVQKSYYVSVHQQPYFITTPQSKQYPSAKTVRLECQANGIPQPEVHWLKNGLPLQMEGRIKKQPTGLVLSHSFTEDAGIYQCVAVNSVGTIWAPVQLLPIVSHPPSPPQNVKCRPFDDTSVCLEWTPPPNVSVQAYSVYSIYAGLGPEFVTAKTHQLATGLDEAKNYTFYIRLYSRMASDRSKKVFCKTGETGTRNLQFNSLSTTSVSLTWSLLSSDTVCGGDTAPFKVQWKKTNEVAINVKYVETGPENAPNSADVFNTTITGLNPQTEYEFRILSCANKNDKSLWTAFKLPSEIDQVVEGTADVDVSNETSLQKPPEHLDLSFMNRTSVNLTWSGDSGNVVYVVCFIEASKGCGANMCKDDHKLRSKTKYMEIHNLKPNTWYEFKVRGYNDKKLASSFSHSLQVQTEPEIIVPPVESLKIEVLSGTEICVKWMQPKYTSGFLSYIVYYTTDQETPLETWNYVKVNGTSKAKACHEDDETLVSAAIRDVKYGKEYTIVVRAVTDAGFGELSKPIFIRTDGDTANVKYKETINQKQKLGVILGVLLAIVCIVACISCLLLRRRCLKRRALARARLITSNNYYRPPVTTSGHETTLSVQLETSCSAEAHEMQQLMTEECPRHIPQSTSTHLDTKGGATFPNGQINGAVKSFQNGVLPNGDIHITENPQFCVHDQDEMPTSKRGVIDDTCGLLPAFKSTTATTIYKEDTNSNLQRTLQNSKGGSNACSMCAQSTTKHCNGQIEPIVNNHCSEIRDVNSINKGGLTYNTQLTF